MTIEEKIAQMQVMKGSNEDSSVLTVYLQTAESKILNHRYPYGDKPCHIEDRYEQDQIELAIVMFNKRGGEGQREHSENGVKRIWRTEEEILSSIPRMAGIPS